MDLIGVIGLKKFSDLEMVVAESKRVEIEKRLKMVVVIAVINLVSSSYSITLKSLVVIPTKSLC